VWLAGGHGARLAIIPVASRQEITREVYPRVFREMGAAECWIVDPDENQVDMPIVRGALEAASGIIITGGDQRLLTRLLKGTLTHQVVLECLTRGTPVYTTSASTSALSDIMVAGLEEDDSVRIEPGLGFLPGITIETHVEQRGRHHRLDEMMRRNVNQMVMGIDENTALVFEPETSRGHVRGTGGVTIHSMLGRTQHYRVGETIELESYV